MLFFAARVAYFDLGRVECERVWSELEWVECESSVRSNVRSVPSTFM